MRLVVPYVAALCAGSCALADVPYANLELLVRRDGGADWSSSAFWAPETTYHFGLRITWSGDLYAFGGATLQVLGVGSTLNDRVEFPEGLDYGRIDGWSYTADTNAIYAMPDGFRIDNPRDLNNTNRLAGLTFEQQPRFDADRSSVVMPFFFDLTTGADGPHRIDVSMPRSEVSRGLVGGIVLTGSGFRYTFFSNFDLHGASIVVPAPGAAGLGVLLAARRRRRA